MKDARKLRNKGLRARRDAEIPMRGELFGLQGDPFLPGV